MTPESTNSSAEEAAVERSPRSALQITAWLFCGVLAFGIVSSAAYLAVRVVSAKSPARAAPPPAVQAVAPTPPRVEPAPVPLPEPPPAPPPVAAPAPAPAKATQSLAISAEEMRGHKFLQVGAVDRGLVEGFVQQLSRRGFTVRVAEGPNENVKRVLLGPLERSVIEAKQAELKQAGYDSFQRNY